MRKETEVGFGWRNIAIAENPSGSFRSMFVARSFIDKIRVCDKNWTVTDALTGVNIVM